MTQMRSKSNSLPWETDKLAGTVAPLTNVSLCAKAMMRAVDRPSHLPGFVCFYGPAGWGKSTAAAYTALSQRAYYIQCGESWVRKKVLQAILKEMGVEPEKTIYDMTDQVCEQLALSGRPLIIDEVDHLINKGIIEIVRDIYEGSGAAILLIGEETVPKKLERWERFHSRVLDWIPAQATDLEDCLHLSRLYCREITIAEELITEVLKASGGSARRVCVNLENIQEVAREEGLSAITLQDWGKRKLFTGSAPVRRVR